MRTPKITKIKRRRSFRAWLACKAVAVVCYTAAVIGACYAGNVAWDDYIMPAYDTALDSLMNQRINVQVANINQSEREALNDLIESELVQAVGGYDD